MNIMGIYGYENQPFALHKGVITPTLEGSKTAYPLAKTSGLTIHRPALLNV